MSQLPAYAEMLRELIALPSISSTLPRFDSSNRAVCEQLANWLQPLGFDCRLQALPAQPQKCNLIATLGQGGGGLVLAGHADTVPCDETGWDSDPFTLHDAGDRWHGLGTADMKGFLALAVELAATVDRHALRAPLVLVATADEESGMDGAKALAAAGEQPGRFVIVGEPTGLQPVRMHKGIFMEGIRIHGKAGHSSNPAAGANALEGMHRALGAVLAYRDELCQREQRAEFPVPYATLNPGCIHGGDSPNRIPAHCELQLDLRMLPGSDPDGLREELRARVRAALPETGLSLEFESVFDGAQPFEAAGDSDLVRACEAMTGSAAGAVDFATEAGYFSQLGLSAVVLGPGNIAQAHQPNEFLEKAQVERMRGILSGLIHRYCLESRDEH